MMKWVMGIGLGLGLVVGLWLYGLWRFDAQYEGTYQIDGSDLITNTR